MRLRIDSDDVLSLVQLLTSIMMKRSSSVTATDALGTANAAVEEYLGIDIEFVVEGYDGAVHNPLIPPIIPRF